MEDQKEIYCKFKKGEEVCKEHNVKTDVITVLQNAKQAIERGDILAIQEESNHIIHCTAIFQTPEAIQTAVIVYALGKMMERGLTINMEILDNIQKAIDFMKVDNLRGFSDEIKTIYKMITTLDEHLSRYMQHIITEAKIKKGSRIYEHGISLRQTAELFGLSQWELMNYIGKTRVNEYSAETVPVQQRMAFARTLFK